MKLVSLITQDLIEAVSDVFLDLKHQTLGLWSAYYGPFYNSYFSYSIVYMFAYDLSAANCQVTSHILYSQLAKLCGSRCYSEQRC